MKFLVELVNSKANSKGMIKCHSIFDRATKDDFTDIVSIQLHIIFQEYLLKLLFYFFAGSVDGMDSFGSGWRFDGKSHDYVVDGWEF